MYVCGYVVSYREIVKDRIKFVKSKTIFHFIKICSTMFVEFMMSSIHFSIIVSLSSFIVYHSIVSKLESF